MDPHDRVVLFEIAAYLKVVHQGKIPPVQAQREAGELLEKVGAILARES